MEKRPKNGSGRNALRQHGRGSHGPDRRADHNGPAPAVRHERQPPRPGPDHVWVGGRWHWDNARWTWVGGNWERPAAPKAYWIAPRYVRSGRGTIYEPGHWSNQTVVVGEDVRSRREWQQHEKEHERELQRERERYNREH